MHRLAYKSVGAIAVTYKPLTLPAKRQVSVVVVAARLKNKKLKMKNIVTRRQKRKTSKQIDRYIRSIESKNIE